MAPKTITVYCETSSKKCSKPWNSKFSRRFCNTAVGLTPTSSWGKKQRWREDSQSETETVWQVKPKFWAPSKAKWELIYYIPSARHVYSHFPESRVSAGVRVTQEDKCQSDKHFPLSPSFPKSFYCWKWCQMVWSVPPVSPEVSLGQLSWLCPLMYLPWEKECRGGKNCQPWLALLSNSWKTGGYQRSFSTRLKTQQLRGYYEKKEFQPSQYTYYNSFW